MKYPVIYIKGRGNHTARFTELTEGQMRIAGDIGAAMGKLMPLKDDHAFILYEQQGEEDIRSIRFLRSWFPGAGIILIISGQLTGEERRAYLGAGVNSAVPDDISRADFLRILQFMTDYTFVHKPVAGSGNDVELFRMPLWKRAFDIAASLSAILLLSPLLIAVAVAVRLDSPGPVIYKSKRVGSNYRIFDFLKFRSMHSDADQRLKELEDLNQYASEPVAEDDAKMALNDDEIRKLLADTENGMLYADDFVIPEEAHQHQLETEQENAFVKIENDPRITRLGRFLRKYSIDELPQLFNILRGDMSVVGPRPLLVDYLPRYNAFQARRHEVRPGLTGLAQVNGRNAITWEEKFAYDVAYADHVSFLLDCRIVAKTFCKVFAREGIGTNVSDTPEDFMGTPKGGDDGTGMYGQACVACSGRGASRGSGTRTGAFPGSDKTKGGCE